MKQAFAAPTGGDAPHAGQAPVLDVVAQAFPQFEIISLIGVGGMGAVYKARQTRLDRLVALKLMLPEMARDPGFAERFTREARTLAQLNHPNLVTVYDFGEAGGFFYFIMEFVDGVNLRQLIHDKQLSPEQALALVPKICDALQFAHDAGVMHRDIKPENILVDKSGRVKIADFGIAKIVGQQQGDLTLTGTGMTLGTPRYMAPEQLEESATVDHRADIYSLGVVIYEMLTGELPLGRFALPSQKVQIDVRLDEVVLHALEKEPARRYQHASEVKQAVEHVTSTPGFGTIGPQRAGAARNGESNPDTLRPMPRFFWLKSFCALTAGWIAVAALWNLGVTGFLLGTVVMAAIVKEIGRTYANRNPLWVHKLHARPPWKRFTILFVSLLQLVFAFILLMSGLFMLCDRLTLGKDAPNGETFEAQYRGKEYQLIRDLAAFKDQVPAVELTKDPIGTSPTNPAAMTFAWLFVLGGLLMLFSYFRASASENLHMDGVPRLGGWRVAFNGLSCFLVSVMWAYAVLIWLFIFHVNGRQVSPPYSSITVHAKVNQVSNAVHRWAAENGCESISSRWDLRTVPKGEWVATAETISVRKDSPFERWEVMSFGLERPFPAYAIQITGSEQPAQSNITISGMGFFVGAPEVGSEKEKQWHAITNSLSAAIAKSTDFDPGLISIETRPIKRTGTGSPWLGLGVALTAMVGCAFVMIRYRTPKAPLVS